MTVFLFVINVLQIVLVIVILVWLRNVSYKLAEDRATAIQELVLRAEELAKITEALADSEKHKSEGLQQVADDLKKITQNATTKVLDEIKEIKETSKAAHEAANHAKDVIDKQYNIAAERAEETARKDPLPDIKKTGEDTNVRVQKLEKRINGTKKTPNQ